MRCDQIEKMLEPDITNKYGEQTDGSQLIEVQYSMRGVHWIIRGSACMNKTAVFKGKLYLYL